MRAQLPGANFAHPLEPPSGNRFLDALTSRSRAALLDGAALLPVTARERLRSGGEPLSHIFFPLRGIVSIVHETADGGAAEIALVGDEGYVGAGALLGATTATNALRIQADGLLAAVDREVFLSCVREDPAVAALAARFAAAYFAGISVSTACNALHPAARRLARWILRMSDRIGESDVPMTQEIAALLIGVRRATVTRAIADVAASGAITYERGAVHITDRAGLEAFSCCCYAELQAIAAGIYPAA